MPHSDEKDGVGSIHTIHMSGEQYSSQIVVKDATTVQEHLSVGRNCDTDETK